jgi:6-pyruvoyltetrahydropterin/6-carboxytetrahydropterin synthase
MTATTTLPGSRMESHQQGYPSPVISMTRRVAFSAAYLINPEIYRQKIDKNATNTENSVFSETSGHNYTLDVCVCGRVDPVTGIVVNIKDIDAIVRRYAVQPLSDRLLNAADGPMPYQHITAASLLEHIHSRLSDRFPDGVELVRLDLAETPTSSAEWKSMTIETIPVSISVTRSYEFSASHRLHSRCLTNEQNQELFGKCNYDNGHGHNYILEVTVTGAIDPSTGQVVDLRELDEAVHREVVDRYDHRHLNLDIPEFADIIPSSELLTYVIWERLKEHIPGTAQLCKVVIRETARNIFEYTGKD